MKKRGLQKSEPELILEIIKRAPDWGVVIALVGGGQEINDGEAGLEEWGKASVIARCLGRSWRRPKF